MTNCLSDVQQLIAHQCRLGAGVLRSNRSEASLVAMQVYFKEEAPAGVCVLSKQALARSHHVELMTMPYLMLQLFPYLVSSSVGKATQSKAEEESA